MIQSQIDTFATHNRLRLHLEIETSWGLIPGADIAETKSEARDKTYTIYGMEKEEVEL